ncbi:MAG: CoA transferase [Myxococcota bacterium]
MPEPLQGLRVVELGTAIQGPAAALFLSDMGAEVIKIEPPNGEANRAHRGVNNPFPPDAHSTQFVAANRGKKSLWLDAKGERGRAALLRLLETADVFVSNFRQSALDKMGYGYEVLRERNARLIYAVVNGFGPQGALHDKAMVDGAAQARGGLLSLTGQPDGPPTLPGAAIADTAGAMQFALGIMTALVARERYGVGQKVNTSGYGTQIWLQMWELTHSSITGKALSRAGNHHPNVPGMYGMHGTADGQHLFLAFPMTTESWLALCEFLGEPELAANERWHRTAERIGMSDPDEHYDHLRARLTAAFLRKSLEDCEAFLDSQPEIIWNRVCTHDDVLSDPQARANGYFVDMEISGVGPTQVVGNLVHLSETPGSAKGPTAEVSQHTEEILLDLGYSWDEITATNEETQAAVRKALTEGDTARGRSSVGPNGPGAPGPLIRR